MNSLVDLFEESVRKYKGRIAISNGNKQYSYEETNEIANQIARYFIGKGIKQGDHVGIYMKKSEHILFLIIGLLKLGVTYVPIDLESPATRVKHIIKKSEVKLLVVDKVMMNNHSCENLTINKLLEESEALDAKNLNINISQEAPAYIIFTSGSTGDPKGVSVSHGNVMSLFMGCHDLFDINDKDKWTFYHSYAFDFSVWEMWGAWIYSGEVILVSFEDSRNPIAFVDLMVRTKATIFNSTPSAFFEMIDEIIERQHELNLKYIIFGGENLNFGKLKAWFSKENTNLPKLINMYGITETTVHVTHKVIKKSDVEKGITNIGKVLPHLGYKVINQHGEEVVEGGEGELYVSGKGVSLGYYKNPEMNEEKFTNIDGVRYYKSGDLVKVLNHGELQYIARNDEQVQLRGYRIELGEIETVYNNLEQIKNAVVTIDKVYKDDMHLVLYYVSSQKLSNVFLREWGRLSLPPYMIPSFFVELDKIPLTVNGKLDKSKLPRPNTKDKSKTIVSEEQIEANHNVVTKLRGAISDILGHSEIDINEAFLEVGFNSLLIMRLMVKIKELFNIELIPSDMLENDSISKLSTLIKDRLDGKVNHLMIPKSNMKSFPLSYEQENLWFLYKTNNDKSLYNISFSYDITGDLDQKKLELALNELSGKQQILKSVVREQAGKGYFMFDESLHHVVSYFDITDKSLMEKEEKINHLIKMELEREFDLETGPLLSVILIKKNNHLYQLVCNIHHIIFDGWSIPIFIESWFDIYEQMMKEEQVKIEEPPIQYGDYTDWQRNSPTYINQEAIKFWANEVSAIKQKSLLQYDYPRLEDNQKYCDTIRFSLPEEIQNRLEVLNRDTKSTLFMTLLTAYQTFLSVYLDEEEVVVGSPLANRNNINTEKLIGYFVNTLPFKIDVSSNDSFEEILTDNIKKISMIFNHQDLPSEEILKFSSLDRSIDSAPLFDTVFVVQNNIQPDLTYQTVELKRNKVDTLKAKFDLVVQIDEMNDGKLIVSFEFDKGLFKKKTIQRMANNFQHWLREITLHQNRKLKDLSYIEPKQLQKLMEISINRTDHANLNQSLFEDVVSRFEKIVKMNPDAIAMVDGDHQITYKELNERANQIAHQLHFNNIGPEDKIGVFIERSIHMVTAILGIMKVGAVYVPLEPSLPKTRLEYMIADSESKYCLTTNEFLNIYPGNANKVIVIDEVIKQAINKDFQSRKLLKSNLAYIIYTSGTTGKPKGVMIEHEGLANLCDWHKEYYSLTKDDAALMVSSSSFDASIWELFPYLTNGNKLVVIDYWDLLDVDTLAQKMEEERVSLGFFSTGLLEQLFINDMKFPESVRAILTGGDRLKTIPNNLSFALYNNYGPTEGTVVSTAYKVENDDGTNIPIGKPISNVETYVFNSKLQLTPLGQIGELYIGGKGIARGYINNTKKNLESFVSNPFKPQERLYRTRDLVRYTEEGHLIFCGRKDDQVKIRGFRVEIEEINSVLKKHTGIKDSIVTIKEESQSRKAIIAYYITDIELKEASIQDFMRKNLPHYMIPIYFIRMSSFH